MIVIFELMRFLVLCLKKRHATSPVSRFPDSTCPPRRVEWAFLDHSGEVVAVWRFSSQYRPGQGQSEVRKKPVRSHPVVSDQLRSDRGRGPFGWRDQELGFARTMSIVRYLGLHAGRCVLSEAHYYPGEE